MTSLPRREGMPPARFQDLYDRHAANLFRYALALAGNRAEAEDLVADTFVRLWTGTGELRETTVKAYLVTILRHLFITRRKRAARHVALDESQPAEQRGHDERAHAALELASVRQHLVLLPELDRTALLMRGNEGLSYEEIGRALGLSAGAVRVRVHRARAQLAKAIGRTLRRTS